VKFKSFLSVLLLALFCLPLMVKAASLGRTDHVEAELISQYDQLQAGQEFYVALRIKMIPHWHTYWKNPGDSGLPTTIDWTLPEGVSAGKIVWPIPEAIPFGPLTNYGYEGEIFLPVKITTDQLSATDQITLEADVNWLVCKEVCIPENVKLDLTIPLAAEAVQNPVSYEKIEQTLQAQPYDLGVFATIGQMGEQIELTVEDGNLAAAHGEGMIRNLHFFPDEDTLINHAAPQAITWNEEGFVLTVGASQTSSLALSKPQVTGLLALEENRGAQWVRSGILLNMVSAQATEDNSQTIVEQPNLPKAEDTSSDTDPGFWFYMLGAFIGGLILNLMPCVFPVISIKILSFMGKAHQETAEIRTQGLMFLAGVLATFLMLGVVLIGLKSAGHYVGWGFQLQSPLIVALLALVFFLIGLNFLGVFELSGSVQNMGSKLAGAGGRLGAFFTGALAVVAASPCTAPFMAGALGFAFIQPAYVSLSIMLALGLGLAAPFVLLSFYPALLRYLPKPGVWMEKFKQFLAFPMFGAVIWLVWVLSQQSGPDGLLAVMITMLALVFGIWLLNNSRMMLWRVVAYAVMIAGLWAGLMGNPYQVETASQIQTTGDERIWSKETVEQLRAEGKPVFVDFTAAWCITCKVNERVALKRPEVQDAFKKAGVTFLIADWTNRNKEITQELAQYGRNGVPLYLLFPPNGEAIILPQILTPSLVIGELEKL